MSQRKCSRKQLRERDRKKAAAFASKAEVHTHWLDRLGLLDTWKVLPIPLKRRVLKSRSPEPTLAFDSRCPVPEYWPLLQKTVCEGWRDAVFASEELRGSMPALEVLTVFLPMAMTLNRYARQLKPHGAAAETTGMLARMSAAYGDRVVQLLVQPLLSQLELHARPRTRHFRVNVDFGPCDGDRFQMRWTVSPVNGESRTFVLDGQSRRGYRAASTIAFQGNGWIEWDAKAMGLDAPVEKLPVYIQGHALDNAEKRMSIAGPEDRGHGAEEWDATMRTIMLDCLAEPRIVKRDGPTLYVEYRWGPYRIGYFIAEVVESAVLVRTFLFLTMQGTPEAEKLGQALRLRRHHMEWTGLDSLLKVAVGDLNSDPGLCEVLEDCGCGYIVAVAGVFQDGGPRDSGMAATLRKLLPPNMPTLNQRLGGVCAAQGGKPTA